MAKAELRRSPGRTSLIFLLAFLPALAGALFVGVGDSKLYFVGEDGEAQLVSGRVMSFSATSDVQAEKLWQYPGVEQVYYWQEQALQTVQFRDRALDMPVLKEGSGGWDAPVLLGGRVDLAESDVILSRSAADHLGAEAGETIRFGTESLLVVGVVDLNSDGRRAYRAPGTLDSGNIAGVVEFVSSEAANDALELSNSIGGPGTDGPTLSDRRANQYADPIGIGFSLYIVGPLMFLSSIIAGAAWSTGYERRLRSVSLAQVGGAETSQIRSAVAMQAMLVSVPAVGAAWIVAAVFASVSERWYAFFLSALVLHVLIVAGLSMFAAWLPLSKLQNGEIGPRLSGRTVDRDGNLKNLLLGGAAGVLGFSLILFGTLSEGVAHRVAASLGLAAIFFGLGHLSPVSIQAVSRLISGRSAASRMAARAMGRQWHRSVSIVIALAIIVALVFVGLLRSQGPDRPALLTFGLGSVAAIALLFGWLMRYEDSERRAVLYRLGADSAIYRRVGAWHGLMLGTCGSALGALLGVAIYLTIDGDPFTALVLDAQLATLVVPYTELVAVVVAAPVLAAVAFAATVPGLRTARRQLTASGLEFS